VQVSECVLINSKGRFQPCQKWHGWSAFLLTLQLADLGVYWRIIGAFFYDAYLFLFARIIPVKKCAFNQLMYRYTFSTA